MHAMIAAWASDNFFLRQPTPPPSPNKQTKKKPTLQCANNSVAAIIKRSIKAGLALL